jgi:hypothetical protein
MLCNFHTLAFTDGLFIRRCANCGATRKVRSARLVRQCTGERPDAETIRGRMNICRQCMERPPGCWKTREYGCQRAYLAAARQTAETAACPIGKLVDGRW